MAASICREHKDVVLRRSRVYKIMQVVLLAKFSGSEDRKAQLMATHRLCLVEGNDWNAPRLDVPTLPEAPATTADAIGTKVIDLKHRREQDKKVIKEMVSQLNLLPVPRGWGAAFLARRLLSSSSWFLKRIAEGADDKELCTCQRYKGTARAVQHLASQIACDICQPCGSDENDTKNEAVASPLPAAAYGQQAPTQRAASPSFSVQVPAQRATSPTFTAQVNPGSYLPSMALRPASAVRIGRSSFDLVVFDEHVVSN
ncbi:hypothetical protein AK812_SmicGene22504, partial [Symbiodinium microadriaticum]